MPKPEASRKNLEKARKKLKEMIQQSKSSKSKTDVKHEEPIIYEVDSDEEDSNTDQSDMESPSPSPPPTPAKHKSKRAKQGSPPQPPPAPTLQPAVPDPKLLESLIKDQINELKQDLRHSIKQVNTDRNLDSIRRFLKTN